MAASTPIPVWESIRQINDTSWLIGSRLVLSRSFKSTPAAWPDNEEGFYYSLNESNGATRSSQPLSPTCRIRLVYDVGDAHAVWKIGRAFLKVNTIDIQGKTREHITLAAVKRMNLSFNVPDVLYHGEWDGRYYVVVSEVPGEAIADIWPFMKEEFKAQCIQQMVKICQELAVHESNQITGVDGNQLAEYFLTNSEEEDFNPASLQQKCESMGMDCSKFHFYHTDLGPTNVLMEMLPDGHVSLSVIDWEDVGFVPKDWIRTKFRLSGAMDLECYDFEDQRRYEWRKRIQMALGEHGFADVAKQWMECRNQ